MMPRPNSVMEATHHTPLLAPTHNTFHDTTSTTHTTIIPPIPAPPLLNHTNATGYSHLPLSLLANDTIRLLSHNINTLHTTTSAELGATFDLYHQFDPTILGLQECKKKLGELRQDRGTPP